MEHLDPSGPLPDEVRRAAHALVGDAAGVLRAGGPPGRAVHVARRRCKQSRALLRMIEGPLGRARAGGEASTLREVGRRLSGMRDADAMVGTVQDLAGRTPPLQRILEPLATRLEEHRDSSWIAFAERDRVWVLAELDALALRTDRWPLDGLGWSAVVDGIARTYRRGRVAARVVAGGGSASDLHDLRKRTKDLRYQVELVRDLWTPVLRGTADGLRQLVDELGVHQDLRLLDDAVRTHGDREWSEADRGALGALVHEEIAASRRRGAALARKVYAEKPDAFARRLRAYARDPGTGAGGRVGDVIALPDASASRP